MLNGSDLWDSVVTSGLTQVATPFGQTEVYREAPRSMYDSLTLTEATSGTDTALVTDDGQAITYGQLLRDVDKFAGDQLHFLVPGDRVLLLMETSAQFVVSLLAVNRQGGIAVPVSTKLRDPELRSLVKKSGATTAVVENRFLPLVTEFFGRERMFSRDDVPVLTSANSPGAGADKAPPADPQADALLIFTSGTTAQSKGVLLTNQNVGHAIVAYERTLGITATDVGIVPVPIYYVTGLVALLGLFIHVGGKLYLQERFDPVRVLSTVREEGVTFIHASPTVFSMLLKHAGEYPHLPSLRMFACGAAHMPVTNIKALHDWLPGAEFRTVYGLTETTSPATVFPVDATASEYCGSSGIPIPGMSLEIRDDRGTPLMVNEVGSVWLKGANILRAYDGIEDTNLICDGWLNTGDLGFVNEDGYLFLVDRSKDMINRGGEKVWSIDVEEGLRSIPGIADAAVVGVPHEIYGEEPAALVVLSGGPPLTAEHIQSLLRTKLASFQVPHKIHFADTIPLTRNLKVDKRAIRDGLMQVGG